MKDKWSNKSNDSLEETCLQYIQEHEVLGRVLEKFIHKYESYGDVSGRVVLNKVSMEEREILEGFFQKNYHGKKQVGITARDLTKALKNSRFAEISPQRLLELYAKVELYSKVEVKQQELEKWKQVFRQVEKQYEGTVAVEWLQSMEETKQYGYISLQNIYREHEGAMCEVKSWLCLGCDIVNQFPVRRNQQEYLAVFATRITGNPHAFDEKNPHGKYLLQILQWEMSQVWDDENTVIHEEFRSLEKQRLYLNVGILQDDISNYATVSGIRAITKSGEYHQGMEGFLAEGDSVQVPLAVLATWSKIICPNHTLYIVENPSVYANLVDRWGGNKAIFCINGQPKLSSLVFLELLEYEKVHIYYWGDFDPEGLLIAQRIKNYYQGLFSYWNMSLEDYKASQSKELISAKRLAGLQKVTDEELQEVVTEMKMCQKAGYQEMLLLR